MLRTRRPLTLHVSALSDAEYAAYTQSLSELASPVSPGKDAEWETVVLSVREARGWIRGRYGACVDGAIIDQILKNFAPELGPQDVLTGGQFFAVMRLVCHAQSGAAVDDSLVFIQANPEPFSPASDSKRASIKSDVALSRRSSGKSNPPPVPPPRPSHESQLTAAAPTTPTLPPRSAPPSTSSNPFARAQSQPPKPPTEPPPASSNPFRISLQNPPLPPSLSSASSSSSSHSPPKYATPPLPPRKPALLPPPRHGSLARLPVGVGSSSRSSTYTPPLPPPPAPPKPPKATSMLIKQSLQAAKGAQSVKEVLDTLSKERRAEVIRKSGTGGSGNTNGAKVVGSGTGTVRSVSPPRSFYDVAAARIGIGSSSSSSISSNERTSTPPAFTVQPASPASPLTVTRSAFSQHPSHPSTAPLPNPRRSKSLHHPSPGSAAAAASPLSPDASSAFPRIQSQTRTHSQSPSPSPSQSPSSHHLTQPQPQPQPQSPPLPPPRRRRPESVQVTRSPFADAADQDHRRGVSRERGVGEGWRPGSAPKHYSVTELDARLRASSNPGPNPTGSGAGAGAGPSMIDALQRTFATLRPGAGFESVRVRAEGRVLPGGYSKMGKGGERLVGEEEEVEGADGDGEEDDGPEVDSNPDLQPGGASSPVPGVGSQGQHMNRHQRYAGDEGVFGQDKEAGVDGAGTKTKPGTIAHPGNGWVSLA
ncbi:hypothetical protein BU17DRAFT_94902 [Hysterangium stoloniferum]|nr:hypothetical protein BU17DRAFT_94902 [Hysterangium stoloniferum]